MLGSWVFFFSLRVTWYKSVFIKKLSATYTEVFLINLRNNYIRFGCSDLLEDRTRHPAVTASLTSINCVFLSVGLKLNLSIVLIQTGVKLIDLKWPWLLPFQNWHTVVISVFVVSLLSHIQSSWSPQLFQESCFLCLLVYMMYNTSKPASPPHKQSVVHVSREQSCPPSWHHSWLFSHVQLT